MEELKYRILGFIKAHKLPLLIAGGVVLATGLVAIGYFAFSKPEYASPVVSEEIAAALSGQENTEEYNGAGVSMEEFENTVVEEETDDIEDAPDDTVENQITDETVYEIEEVEPTAEELAQMASPTPEPEPEKKPVDLIMFMGSSNMSGLGGDKNLAPVVSEVIGHEYRVNSNPDKLFPIMEPFGAKEDDDIKNGSLVSAFVNKYNEECGHNVVAVSNSKDNTSITYWTDASVMEDSKNRFTKAITWLNDNGYEVERKYIVWLQGENDFQMNPDDYSKNLIKVMNNLIDAGAEQMFIITPGRVFDNPHAFDLMVQTQQMICEVDSSFTLASSKLYTLDPATSMIDALNYNQDALNQTGEEAGFIAGSYTKREIAAQDL